MLSLTYLFSTEQWRGHTMSGAMQAFFGHLKERQGVCQRWLTKDEKRPDAEARPECYAFGGSGFPLCSLPLAAACRCAAAVYRRAAAVCRLPLWLFAVVLRLLTFVLAVFHRRFTLMLRASFSGGGGGLSAAKAMTTFQASLRRRVKPTSSAYILSSDVAPYFHRGKSEDKMEEVPFRTSLHPTQTFSPAAVISRRNSRLMAASVSTLPPQSAISHSRRLGQAVCISDIPPG